jgi:hypothetical protein
MIVASSRLLDSRSLVLVGANSGLVCDHEPRRDYDVVSMAPCGFKDELASTATGLGFFYRRK